MNKCYMDYSTHELILEIIRLEKEKEQIISNIIKMIKEAEE